VCPTEAAARPLHQNKAAATEGCASHRPPRIGPSRGGHLTGRSWRLRASPPPRSLLPVAAENRRPPSPVLRPGCLLRRDRPEQGRNW
jgi:hypothetical protein